MSTTTSPPSPPAAAPWWKPWADFWFRPADPTTLGFIRIATGLLVLYVHLAYTADLQAFFGKNGWYAVALVNKERKESPSLVSPLTSWQPLAFARMSDFPHRRQAFMEFLRAVPGPNGERAGALAYLNRANALANPDDFRRAMVFVQRMSTREDRDNKITVIVGGQVKDEASTEVYRQQIPEFFRAKDQAERQKIADEIRAFWTVLPRTETGRTYVLQHFIEIPAESRIAMVRYINELPEGNAERAKRLDYLEYWNVDDQAAYRTGFSTFSFWFHVTDPTQMAVLHATVILLIVLFTLGLFTRVTSVLVWISCLSYIHRTQQVLFGMDTMMNILLFYLMIGNSGAALSLDRLIARYRAARASLRRTGMIDVNTRAFLAYPPPSVGAGFAIRLLQVHVCFIYTAAGLSKLKGSTWWTGLAFWEVVVNPEFTLLRYPWYEKALRAMTNLKPLFYFTCTVTVWFTLFVEICLPFLVWTKARWWILLLATAMHAGIGVLMGLNLFELMMIVMFLAFLPDRVVRDRLRGGPDLPKLTLAVNPASDSHQRAAALALALDVDNQIRLTGDKSVEVPAVTGPDGATTTGADGTRVLTRGLRFLSAVSWLLLLPGLRALLTRKLFPPATASPPAGVKPPTPTPAR